VLSPFNADWSQLTCPLKTGPSAGTFSPLDIKIISPLTTALVGIFCFLPERITDAVPSLVLLRRSNASSLLYSETVETVVDIKMAAIIPKISK
jgi:hypothetical protein